MRHSRTARTRLSRPSRTILTRFLDRGFQWLLDSPGCLATVLALQRPDLVPLLDLPRAMREPRSLVPADLRRIENDALYRIPFRPDVPAAYPEVPYLALLDHKGAPDPRTPVQALEYVSPIWFAQAPHGYPGQYPAPRLSPTGIYVIYTGSQPWPTPPDLPALVSGPSLVQPGGSWWQWSHLDLPRLPPDRLRALGTPMSWAFRLTQVEAAGAAVYEAVLREEVLPGLEAAAATEREEVHRVVWYAVQHLYHRRGDTEYSRLMPELAEWSRGSKFHLRQGVQAMLRTMAQIHREEGVQIGRTEGVQIGEQAGLHKGAAALREALSGLLLQKFGGVSGGVQGALEAADLGKLLAWHQRALNATTLDDVGISANGAQPQREL